MALTGEALLEDTLFRHLATLVTVPTTAFSWPNIENDGLTPRLEVQHLPNTSRGNLLDDSKDLVGFLTVTVVHNRGIGSTPLTDIATQIINHFPQTLTLFTTDYRIRFTQPASYSQIIPDGAETRLTVSIPYIAND